MISNPTEKRARATGKLLLEQNPARQQEILDLILRLQKQSKSQALLRNQAASRLAQPITRLGVQQIPQAISE